MAGRLGSSGTLDLHMNMNKVLVTSTQLEFFRDSSGLRVSQEMEGESRYFLKS